MWTPCYLCLVAKLYPSCNTTWTVTRLPGSSVHGFSKDTEVGCHAFLRVFLTQGSNMQLLCWQAVSTLDIRKPEIPYYK